MADYGGFRRIMADYGGLWRIMADYGGFRRIMADYVRIMGDYGGLCLFIRLDKLSHIFGLNPANLSLFAFQNAYTLRKIHIFKFLQW